MENRLFYIFIGIVLICLLFLNTYNIIEVKKKKDIVRIDSVKTIIRDTIIKFDTVKIVINNILPVKKQVIVDNKKDSMFCYEVRKDFPAAIVSGTVCSKGIQEFDSANFDIDLYIKPVTLQNTSDTIFKTQTKIEFKKEKPVYIWAISSTVLMVVFGYLAVKK
jgi:hypothetical protein